jgi:A/G-specific adenine glycosylase
MDLKPLLSWSQTNHSELPWRKHRTLYRTLVSEIMLQQTTVGTVKNHYERFLERFPTIESLAEASEDELTVAWKGLGYYRRARNLKKIAEAIVFEHQGAFPKDLESLQKIPGIGPYTASSIVGIGMDQRALAVDANLERVIARLFKLKLEKGLKLQKQIQTLFQEKKIFNSKVSFRALNEALMDLGRTYCQARKASCELCPLKKDCQALQAGNPLSYPVQSSEKKKTQEHELHLLRVFVQKKDKLLVYQKGPNEWLAGQFEVPTFVLKSSDPDLKQYPKLHKNFKATAMFTFSTGITKYKITNSVVLLTEKEFKALAFAQKLEWRSVTAPDANLTTATLKAIHRLTRS